MKKISKYIEKRKVNCCECCGYFELMDIGGECPKCGHEMHEVIGGIIIDTIKDIFGFEVKKIISFEREERDI